MSAALVGPLRPVRYATGPTEWHDLPRNTLDGRYAACGNHHLACDCREAAQAEDINEWRLMFRELERAILDAIKGHQTYAYTGLRDSGLGGDDDEFAQCKCQACGIARAASVGFSECMSARREAYDRLADQAAERDRAWAQANYSYTDEPPF
ncbi:MAG: hypothetical protein ACRDRJ_08135 [Streptosporangiaceae bacterium]